MFAFGKDSFKLILIYRIFRIKSYDNSMRNAFV